MSKPLSLQNYSIFISTWSVLFCFFQCSENLREFLPPDWLMGQKKLKFFSLSHFRETCKVQLFSAYQVRKTLRKSVETTSQKMIMFLYDACIVKFLDELYVLQFSTNSLQDVYNFWWPRIRKQIVLSVRKRSSDFTYHFRQSELKAIWYSLQYEWELRFRPGNIHQTFDTCRQKRD